MRPQPKVKIKQDDVIEQICCPYCYKWYYDLTKLKQNNIHTVIEGKKMSVQTKQVEIITEFELVECETK